MKRLSRERRAFLLRKARWAEEKRRKREGFGSIYGDILRESRSPLPIRSQEWLPEHVVPLRGPLCLQSRVEPTLQQLHQLDLVAGRSQQFSRVRILLDEVTDIDGAALLYLCSRIGTLRQMGLRVVGTWPKDTRVAKALVDGGFSGFLKGETPAYDASTRTLQLIEGTGKQRVKPDLAANVRLFLKELNPRLSIEEVDHINIAVMECLENVRVHAYGAVPHRNSGKRWYLAGTHDEARHLSTVAILDLGVGIRSTVETQLGSLSKLYQRATHSTHDLIKEATLGLRTETGERHRGKGLRTLRDFAHRGVGRRLFVASYDGCVTWSSQGLQATGIPSFHGTIVCLEISTA